LTNKDTSSPDQQRQSVCAAPRVDESSSEFNPATFQSNFASAAGACTSGSGTARPMTSAHAACDAIPTDELVGGELHDTPAMAFHVDAFARRQIEGQWICAVRIDLTRLASNAADQAAPC